MRLLTAANLSWVVRHRAWTPYYLKRYWRFAWFKLRHPQVITEGFVFLGKQLEIVARPGHGRIVLGKWVHLGDETRLRAHEGTLRIGDKVVFARDVTVNCYLDIEIGASTLIADWTYICDFDHKTDDLDLPIKDQGLVKSPVRIGPDCWLATKVTVTRGTDIGRGVVIGANSVARGNIPAYADRRRGPGRRRRRPHHPVRGQRHPSRLPGRSGRGQRPHHGAAPRRRAVPKRLPRGERRTGGSRGDEVEAMVKKRAMRGSQVTHQSGTMSRTTVGRPRSADRRRGDAAWLIRPVPTRSPARPGRGRRLDHAGEDPRGRPGSDRDGTRWRYVGTSA